MEIDISNRVSQGCCLEKLQKLSEQGWNPIVNQKPSKDDVVWVKWEETDKYISRRKWDGDKFTLKSGHFEKPQPSYWCYGTGT